MLLLAISELDLAQRHRLLYRELSSGLTSVTTGASCTVTLNAGEWFLECSAPSQPFTVETVEGETGVISGGWGFRVLSVESETKIKFEWFPYPSIDETLDDVDKISPVGFSIAGFSSEIIKAGQVILGKMLKQGFYPQAFIWDIETKTALMEVFEYKALSIIMLDKRKSAGDRWHSLYSEYLKLFEISWREYIGKYDPTTAPADESQQHWTGKTGGINITL